MIQWPRYATRYSRPIPKIKYIQIWNSRVFPYYFVSSRTRQLASPHAPRKVALASVILRISGKSIGKTVFEREKMHILQN